MRKSRSRLGEINFSLLFGCLSRNCFPLFLLFLGLGSGPTSRQPPPRPLPRLPFASAEPPPLTPRASPCLPRASTRRRQGGAWGEVGGRLGLTPGPGKEEKEEKQEKEQFRLGRLKKKRKKSISPRRNRLFPFFFKRPSRNHSFFSFSSFSSFLGPGRWEARRRQEGAWEEAGRRLA